MPSVVWPSGQCKRMSWLWLISILYNHIDPHRFWQISQLVDYQRYCREGSQGGGAEHKHVCENQCRNPSWCVLPCKVTALRSAMSAMRLEKFFSVKGGPTALPFALQY